MGLRQGASGASSLEQMRVETVEGTRVTPQCELANGHSGPWPRFPGAVGPRARLSESADWAPACRTTTSARDFVFQDVLQGGCLALHLLVAASVTDQRELPTPSRAGHGIRLPRPFQPHLKKLPDRPAGERKADLEAHVAQLSSSAGEAN